MDHVHELRRRVLGSVAIFFIGAVIGYLERTTIIEFLQHPLHQELYYTTPTGSFESIMQVCGLAGLLVALPVLVYNLMRFIEPALPRPLSRRLFITVIGLSFGLAVGGAAFAYYVSLPTALHFFGSVDAGSLHALISVNQYFRFVFAYLATFAIVFQLPLVLLLIDHVTPLGPTQLRKARRWVILGAFGLGVLVPATPDPLSQAILALPIILLYELSLIALWLRHRRRQKRQAVTLATQIKTKESLQNTAQPIPAAPTHIPAVRPQIPAKPRYGAPATIDLRAAQSSPKSNLPVHVLDLRNLAS